MRVISKLSLIGCSALSIAIPAYAQEVSAADRNTASITNEIIVQARRRGEDIQDVPLVVQAVTAQEITKLNIREFKDIQTLVPGLAMAQEANGIQNRTTLRGVAYDVTASGNNGTVEFYMNDAPLSAGILFQSMFDVDQIEVLRGPQGTLRGRASPSGSITVTTRRPNLSEAGGYLIGTLNNIGGWNLNGAINVSIIADKLAVRVAGLVDENEDGRIHSINNPADPYQKNRAIRASVQFDPIDELSLFFSYNNTDRRVLTWDQVESLPGAAVQIDASDRLAVGGVPRLWSQNFSVFNWQSELRLFGQKLNYVGSYSKQRYYSDERNDRGGLFVGFPAAVQDAALHSFVHGDQENHEIRLSSDERIAGIFDYVVGFLDNKLNTPSDLIADSVVFRGPPSPATFVTTVGTPIFRDGQNSERSFFGNVTAHISEMTELSGGIRRIRFSAFSTLCFNAASGPGSLCPPNQNPPGRTYHATIYSASAKHKFTEDLMAYATFGTSWRANGGTNPTLLRNYQSYTPALEALLIPPPEKSKSYEIGIKSDWFDNRLRVNVSAYHQTFKNFQYFVRSPFVAGWADVARTQPLVDPTISGLSTGVPAKVSGVEAELSFNATPNWNIGAVLSYTDSKISNGSVPCNDFFPTDGTPDSVSTIPTFDQIMAATDGAGVAFCTINSRAGLSAPFSATVQSEYSHPLSDRMDGYLRGLLVYNSNSQNDPLNAVDDIKAYATVNLFAGLRDPEGVWDISAYVKNLFDTERVLTRNVAAYNTPYLLGRTPTNAATAYRGISMTPPRELGVTARFSFGSR